MGNRQSRSNLKVENFKDNNSFFMWLEENKNILNKILIVNRTTIKQQIFLI